MSDFEDRLLFTQADELAKSGQFQEAEAIYRELLANSKISGDTLTEMRARLGVSFCLGNLGRPNEALVMCSAVILWIRDPSANTLLNNNPLAVSIGCLALLLATEIGFLLSNSAPEMEKVLSASLEAERFMRDNAITTYRARLLIIKSRILSELGRKEEAKQLAEEAAFGTSADSVDLVTALVTFTMMGESEIALRVFDKVDDVDNTIVKIEYHISLAIELAEATPPELSEALGHLRKAVALAERTDSTIMLYLALVLQADIAGELERWAEVNETVRKLYAILPDLTDKTKSQLLEVLGIDSICGAVTTRLPLERAIEAASESSDALATTQEIIKCMDLLGCNHYPVYCALADIYARQKLYEKSISTYRQVIDSNPEIDFPYNNLADIYFKLGQFDEAAELYSKRIDLSPGDALNAYVNLGIIALAEGKRDKAHAQFSLAMSIWDAAWERKRQPAAGLLENKAIILIVRGEINLAIGILKEALSKRSKKDEIEIYRFDLLVNLRPPLVGADQLHDLILVASKPEIQS